MIVFIFVVQVKPAEHKLVLQVFDENRLTRDDFLGMVELNLINIPKEGPDRTIHSVKYLLQPRRYGQLLVFFSFTKHNCKFELTHNCMCCHNYFQLTGGGTKYLVLLHFFK